MDGNTFKGLLSSKYNIQVNKTSRNSVLVQSNINNTRSDVALLIKVLLEMSQQIDADLAEGGEGARAAFAKRVKNLMEDVPDLPNFSRFHDGYRENPESITLEGDMRTAFFAAYEEDDCEYLALMDPKIDERLKSGPELVSANFVIPYPPGFPIMVPGQVIAADTIGYMRKLDVKEIHGYNNERGLKLIKLSAIPPSNGKTHIGAWLSQAVRCGAQNRTSGAIEGQVDHQAIEPRAAIMRLPSKVILIGDDMEVFLKWLAAYPYILLFFVVGAAVLLGKVTIKGYGLGMVASAIVVGAGVSAWASTYGIKMELNNFAKSLFYYLFMYGVGLRVGPSFINSLKGDGLKFTFLAVFCSVLGLLGAVALTKLWDLPAGAAGGILAGAMTMSAAIGSAEEAVRQGAFKLADGQTADSVSGIIALSYGLTYIWGTVGIILICKYLPRWWGVDAKAAAKQYELEKGVPNLDDAGLTGYRPLSLRAYRLTNNEVAGKTVRQFLQKYPQYKIVNIRRGDENIAAARRPRPAKG